MKHFLFKNFFHTIFFLIVSFAGKLYAVENRDSLKSELLQKHTISDNIDLRIKLAEYYLDFNPDSSIYWIDDIVEKYKIKEKSYQNCVVNRIKGIAFSQKMNHDSSLYYFNKALNIAYSIENPLKIASGLLDMGMVYSDLGAYNLSSKYLLQGVQYFEQHKDSFKVNILPYFYNVLGSNYSYLKQDASSIKYYLEGIKLSSGNSINKANLLNNLAMEYLEKKDYSLAKNAFEEAIRFSIDNDLERKKFTNYLSYANLLLEINSPDSALMYIDSAIHYFDLYEDKQNVAYGEDNKGNILRVKKQYSVSEKYLLQAKEKFESIEDYYGLANNYKNLYLLYQDMGKYQSSLEYYQQYVHLDDSISNNIMASDLFYLDKYYETEKKVDQIKLLEKDNLLQQSKLRRNWLLLIGVIFISLLLIFLLFILRRSNRFKEETNKLLTEKNQQLKVLNATKDKLFSIIAHDLKNPLSAFRNITGSLKQHLFNLSKEEIFEYLSNISDSSDKLFLLLQNLLKWSLSQTETITVSITESNIYDLSQSAIESLKYNGLEKEIVIENNIHKQQKGNVDDNIFETIIRNYLSNSIKFTNRGGKIEIYCQSMQNNTLKICVKDNGIGISDLDKSKVFSIEGDSSTIGVSNEKGTGLGLILCKELAEKMSAHVGFESQLHEGSVFYIIIQESNHV